MKNDNKGILEYAEHTIISSTNPAKIEKAKKVALEILEENYNDAKDKLEEYEISLASIPALPKDKRRRTKYHKELIANVKKHKESYNKAYILRDGDVYNRDEKS